MKVIAIFMMTFSFCQILHGQKLKIELFNKTGYDLDSVSVGDNYVGELKKDSSVMILDCKQIRIVSRALYNGYGIIKNKTKQKRLIRYCWRGIKNIKKGDFKFDITLVEDDYSYAFFWDHHE